MAFLLSLDNLSKSYRHGPLFAHISFSCAEGERIGLIGPNGSGKSTLLKILAGQEHSDEGEITTKRNLRLGYLPQTDDFPAGATVESVLIAAQDDDSAGHHLDDHEKQVRATIAWSKMGFTDGDQKADALSGGWRKRLALAREIIREPEFLLLDEPTNHLDLEGIEWLENFLQSANFAFLLVSHDRYFLDNITTRIIELNSAFPEGFLSIDGAYSDFLEKKEHFLQGQATRETALAGKVRREAEWLKRGPKARGTKAKGRIENAHELMSELAAVRARNTSTGKVTIDFNSTDRQTRKLVAAQKISKSMGGRPLFKDLDFILGAGTRLGLVGPNGSGKSTLLRLIAGLLEPDTGTIKRAEQLRIVTFDQKREQLDPDELLKQALAPGGDSINFRGKPMHVTAWARLFLFRNEQLAMRVGDLSGGEQARILIARLMLKPADLLILDEPTNDLDIESIEVLEESLLDFPGALVLVTHDRSMMDRVATEILGLDGHGGSGLYGDYSQFERAKALTLQLQAAEARKSSTKEAARSDSAKPKRLSYMEQRELETIESRITQAESELHSLQSAVSDPKIMKDRTRHHEACAKAAAADELVQTLYARWQELEAKRTR